MATKKKVADNGYLHIKREPIPYKKSDVNKTIEVDWKAIFELYNKLGCPKEYYNPSTLPIDKAAFFFLTSERNTGKTTNLLLITMLLWQKYGMISGYLRQREEEVTPKELKNLMNVILANGYIKKITDGQYNGVRYWARHYTFVRWDASGKKEAESDPFLWVGDIQENLNYKSTLNLPTCNMVIFDEFIEGSFLPDEFVTMLDLHKTISRNRSGLKWFMCANTTNYYHEYFQEFMIQEEVLNCEENKSFIKATELGTVVYYHRVGAMDPAKIVVNREYYGFNNPKLKSITGGGWSMKAYQHWPSRFERKVVERNHFILFMERYYMLEFGTSPEVGAHVFVHIAKNTPKPGAVIYTLGEITSKFMFYRFGSGKFSKILWDLYDKNKWYYATNDIGFSVESYVNRATNL